MAHDRLIAVAAERPIVTLDDGRTGRLQHVTPRSRIATVLIAGHRHRVPVDRIDWATTTRESTS